MVTSLWVQWRPFLWERLLTSLFPTMHEWEWWNFSTTLFCSTFSCTGLGFFIHLLLVGKLHWHCFTFVASIVSLLVFIPKIISWVIKAAQLRSMSVSCLPGKILSPDRHRRRRHCRPEDRAEEIIRDGFGREQEGQEVGGGHPERPQGKEDEEADWRANLESGKRRVLGVAMPTFTDQ